MSIIDRLHDWAAREVAEVRQAPGAIIVLLIVGFVGGWWTARLFYAERIEVLQQRVDLATAAAGKPLSVPASSSLPWPSVTLWVITGIGVVVAVSLAVSNKRKRQQVKALINQVDRLQDEARTKSKDREGLTSERDEAIAALKDKKHEYAMETLERYSNMRFKDGIKPKVTIRYCSYGEDYDLAQRIKGVFTQYVRWSVVLDGKNDPALPRADKSKVVFDIGTTVLTYSDLYKAFVEGDLLGVTVGGFQNLNREDSDNLIVMVLPSVGAEPIKAADPAMRQL